MKRFILFLTIGLLVMGCQKQEKAVQENKAPQTETAASVDLSQYQPLFQQYFHLKNALVEGDQQKAANALAEITKTLMQTDQNSEQTQQLLSEAKKLMAASEIAQMRNGFNSFSLAMAEYAKAKSAGGVVYVQFCPMAMNNNGGYWLSPSENIENPYFGEQMLHCGEVKETITAN
jgi:hypothetical protein